MIKKCIIPIVARGDNWLPISEFVAKEMFPIMNYPLIHYTFQEVFRSGLNKIAIVITYDKEVIREYLYNRFSGFIGKGFTLEFIYQEQSYSVGEAILECEHFIQEEPFAVVLPDDLFFFQSFPLIKLMDTYMQINNSSPVLALSAVDKNSLDSYSSFNLQKKNSHIYRISKFFNKEDGIVSTSSSYRNSLRTVGRYVFPPEIFEYLHKLKAESPDSELNEELFLNFFLENGKKVFGCLLNDRCFDVGTVKGFVEANHKFYNF